MLLSLNTPTAPEVAHIESPKLRLLSPNCAFCPKIRDGGSTLTGKTRLVEALMKMWALGGRTLDVERFTEGARRRVLDGGVLDGGVLEGGVLDGRVLDGRVLDGGVLDEGVLDGRVLDGGSLDRGALDGRALDGRVLGYGYN